MRALVYSDTPLGITGFATVSRSIFGGLIDRGVLTPDDVSFFGVNSTGDWDPQASRFHVWPARAALSNDMDPYGRQRFVQMVLSNVWPFDVLFVCQDHFTVAPFLPGLIQQLRQQCTQGRPPFRVIYYVPVDGVTLRPEWVQWIPELVDYPVAYMHWSARVLTEMVPALRPKLRTIYHGTDPETYFPVSAEDRQAFRRNVLNLKDDQPLVIWVNRNQPRKDPARALQIFAAVRAKVPKAVLYMHCNVVDSMGFNLDSVRQQLRLPQGAVMFPAGFSEGVGVPVEVLNLIYNAGDVHLVTARGEGWGLCLVDSLCTGIPVVAPKHTSFAEILAEDRGILVPTTEQALTIMDNDQLRPVADIEGMAAKVCWAIEHPEHARGIGRRGMAWAQSQSWRHAIVPQWEQVFRDAAAGLVPAAGPQVAVPGVHALRPEALPA